MRLVRTATLNVLNIILDLTFLKTVRKAKAYRISDRRRRRVILGAVVNES